MTAIESLKKVADTIWELPKTFKRGMIVPGRIYATEALIRKLDEGVLPQLANVACLPGIVGYAFCMPDGHWGMAFQLGG